MGIVLLKMVTVGNHVKVTCFAAIQNPGLVDGLKKNFRKQYLARDERIKFSGCDYRQNEGRLIAVGSPTKLDEFPKGGIVFPERAWLASAYIWPLPCPLI